VSRAAGDDAANPTPDPAVRSSEVPAERAGGVGGAEDGTTVTVWRSADDSGHGPGRGHGSVTVFVEGDHACRHLVDYASEECRALLEGLPEGATLPVEMERVAGRCDGWRVTGLP
jgi:hypothetical protein